MICATQSQFLQLAPIVVTNCTTRKRAPDPPIELSPEPTCESLKILAEKWASQLSKAPRRTTGGNLYVGRSMVESKRVARSLGADLYVISAGLGLVHESDLVPNYDLTVGAFCGPLQATLKHNGESVANWWTLLTAASSPQGSLAGLVNPASNRLVLIALPASYLRLISDDLAMVDPSASQRLRIFTSEAGRLFVPASLKHCVLPYDERLETLGGYDGTRAEFPQRSLKHFVEVLGGHKMTSTEAHAAVESALAGLDWRAEPTREKRSDEQIKALLHQNWTIFGGSSTRLLRFLRDDVLVACEQSRFSMLCRTVRAQYHAQEVYDNERE